MGPEIMFEKKGLDDDSCAYLGCWHKYSQNSSSEIWGYIYTIKPLQLLKNTNIIAKIRV